MSSRHFQFQFRDKTDFSHFLRIALPSSDQNARHGHRGGVARGHTGWYVGLSRQAVLQAVRVATHYCTCFFYNKDTVRA